MAFDEFMPRVGCRFCPRVTSRVLPVPRMRDPAVIRCRSAVEAPGKIYGDRLRHPDDIRVTGGRGVSPAVSIKMSAAHSTSFSLDASCLSPH